MGCSESAHAAAIREFKADQKAAGVPVYAPDVKTVDEKARKKIGCRYNYRRHYRHMVYIKEMGGLDKYESIQGWIQSFPEPKLRELMAMHPEVRYDASPGWEKGSVDEKLSGKAVGREFAPCYTWGITKTVRMISTPALGGAVRVAQPGEVDADDGSGWLRNERLYPEECAYYGIAPPILRSFDEQRELLTKGGFIPEPPPVDAAKIVLGLQIVKINATLKQAQGVIHIYDENDDGHMSAKEFMKLAVHLDKAGPKKWWAEVLEELERRGWTEGSPLPVLPEAVVDPSPADRFKNRIYVQSPNFVKEHEQWWGNVSAWWTIDAKPSDTASILKLKIAATDADHRNLVGPNRATANVQNRFAPDQFTLSCRDPTRLNPNNGRIEMRDLEDDETLESRGVIPGHEDGGPGGNGSLSIISLRLRPGAKPGYKPAPPAVVATPVIEVTQQVTTVTHTQQVTTTEALWLAPDGTTFMQRMEVITTTSTITTMTMTTYLLAQYPHLAESMVVPLYKDS